MEKNPKKKKREVTTENTALLHNVSIQFLIPLTKFGLLASTSGGGCLSAACDDCQSVIPSWTEIFFFLVNIVFIICVAVVVTIPTAANVFFFFPSWVACLFVHGLLHGLPPSIARCPRAESMISAGTCVAVGHQGAPSAVLRRRRRRTRSDLCS